LTPQQTKVYDEMKELALAQLEDGDLSTTASVLTQIMRLQQITCGFLQPDDGPIQDATQQPHCRELMKRGRRSRQGKIIIWATWTHDILRDRIGQLTKAVR
jgi:hypothetical protein